MHTVGDRVILTRAKSVDHFKHAPFGKSMPITGYIVAVDFSHYEGKHQREVQIQFDDDRVAWYGLWEITAHYSGAYGVFWFRNGNNLVRRAHIRYKNLAMARALEWQDKTDDWRDSIQVYEQDNLIWADGRAINRAHNKSPA